MVQVFSHTYWDGQAGETYVAEHKKTAEAIARIGEAPIASTAEDVDAAFIAHQGRYMPEWKER